MYTVVYIYSNLKKTQHITLKSNVFLAYEMFEILKSISISDFKW